MAQKLHVLFGRDVLFAFVFLEQPIELLCAKRELGLCLESLKDILSPLELADSLLLDQLVLHTLHLFLLDLHKFAQEHIAPALSPLDHLVMSQVLC